MANLPISGLPAGSALAGTEPFPAVQSATTVKVTATQIKTFTSNAPTFTGVAAFDAGAAALPSIIPTGDTNTGFWFPAADTIAASTGGTERVRIDSSGNVGIGTTAPGSYAGYSSLAVNGSTGGIIDLQVGGARHLTLFSGASASTIGTVTATNLGFQTGNSEKMRITSAGNVGIGTTAPTQKLQVNGNVLFTPAGGWTIGQSFSLYLGDTAGSVAYDYDTTNMALTSYGFISFKTNFNAVEKMRITSTGNVGIGTTSPNTILELGNPGSLNQAVRVNSSGTNAAFYSAWTDFALIGVNRNPATGTFTDIGKAAASLGLYSASGDSYINFSTTATNNAAPTERMRIDSAGNVGIGTTAPQALLDVYSTGNTTLRISGSSGGGSSVSQIDFFRIGSNVSSSIVAIRDGGNTSGALTFYTAAAGATAERMRIDSAGNVGIGTTASPTGAAKVMSLGTATAPTADVAAGDCAIWFDGTNLKARVGATVRTISWT